MTQAADGWFVDPIGRFDGRFFDGKVWTDQVSQDGVQTADPDWLLTSTKKNDAEQIIVADEGSDSAASERRRGSDRRQINIAVDVDRRQGDRRQSQESETAQESEAA